MFFETIRAEARRYQTDDNGEQWRKTGRDVYASCPMRKAGRCGRAPATWTREDMEIWIDGCGNRSCCPRQKYDD